MGSLRKHLHIAIYSAFYLVRTFVCNCRRKWKWLYLATAVKRTFIPPFDDILGFMHGLRTHEG